MKYIVCNNLFRKKGIKKELLNESSSIEFTKG